MLSIIDEDCTYTFQTCSNVAGYDLSSYLSLPNSDSWDSIEIGVTISSAVNVCAYSTTYYLYAQAQVTCGYNYTQPLTTDYATTSWRTTQTFDYYYYPTYSYDSSDTEFFGCTYGGCTVERTWKIQGRCVNPRLRVSIIETDFADSAETANVYVNGGWIDTCSELNEDCSYDWVQCSGAYNYDLSGDLYLPYSYSEDSITIGFAVSTDVNTCFYSSTYALYAQVTLVCNNGGGYDTTRPWWYETTRPWWWTTEDGGKCFCDLLFSIRVKCCEEYSVCQTLYFMGVNN